MLHLLTALLRGLAMGVVAGVPAGPASAAVADVSLRGSLRRGLAAGLGGALVDFGFCLAAATGVAAAVGRWPDLVQILSVVGGAGLIAFSLMTLRGSLRRSAEARPAEPARPRKRALLGSFATGLLVSLANPGLAASWVLMAGAFLSDLSFAEVFAASVGVFCAALAWFSVVAWLAHRGGLRLGAKVALLQRVVAVVLLGYGVLLLGRGGIALAASGGVSLPWLG